MKNERRIAQDIYVETMKELKGFTIQATISNSAHSDYEELVDSVINSKELVDSVSDSNSDPKVATHTSDGNSATDTTNRNSPHKLLAIREILAIIQCFIPLVHQATIDGVLHVEEICMRYVQFSQRISSQARRPALRVFSKTLRR